MPPYIDHSSVKDFSRSVNNFFEFLFTQESSFWSSVKNKHLTKLYTTLREVPAYQEISKKNKKNSPLILTKKNYLRAFPWDALLHPSARKTPSVLTATSGSTGAPFYFPRNETVDLQSSVMHELFLRSSGITKQKKVLIVDSFGMGVWIGGLITYQAFKYVSERGYTLSIITPGINKKEIYNAFLNVASHYDTVILCGYPPFIKDVIDGGENASVDWKNYDLKIIFAAESFSENFREYIAKKAGIKDMYGDTMNIYGSADLGTMAQETPLSILIRRLALENDTLYQDLFGSARLPTLAQFVPHFVSFEEEKGRLLCSGDSTLPLLRYDIGDNGGVFTFDEVDKICRKHGIDISKELKRIKKHATSTRLPFVYVYERSDFSTSFYGAIIYPEYIKNALFDGALEKFCTGKFSMVTKNDTNEDQYLEIVIELHHNIKETKALKKQVEESILNSLKKQSAEFMKIFESIGKRAHPKIKLLAYGDEKFFSPFGKQKWITKQ